MATKQVTLVRALAVSVSVLLVGCTTYEQPPKPLAVQAPNDFESMSLSEDDYIERVFSSNPLAYFPLNVVTSLVDLKGGASPIVVNGPLGFGDSPFAGVASDMKMNGVNQYLSLADSAALRLETFSLELFFRIDGTSPSGGANTLVSKGNLTGYGVEQNFQLAVYNDGGLLMGRVGTGTTAINVLSQVRVDDGKWHHVVMTCLSAAGTDPSFQLKLYLDGELQTAASSLGTVFTTARGPVDFGAWQTPSIYGALNGQLAHVAIYNRALPVEEVDSHLAP